MSKVSSFICQIRITIRYALEKLKVWLTESSSLSLVEGFYGLGFMVRFRVTLGLWLGLRLGPVKQF